MDFQRTFDVTCDWKHLFEVYYKFSAIYNLQCGYFQEYYGGLIISTNIEKFTISFNSYKKFTQGHIFFSASYKIAVSSITYRQFFGYPDKTLSRKSHQSQWLWVILWSTDLFLKSLCKSNYLQIFFWKFVKKILNKLTQTYGQKI